MLLNIIKFELQYRLKRPATILYFALLFLFCFLSITWEGIQFGGDVGQVKTNSPHSILAMSLLISMIVGLLMNSGIMGVPVLRDFEHKTESLMFTTPIRKFDYLFGRFIGSLLVALFVFSGVWLGFALACLSPWADADKMLPFQFYTFLHPFLFFVAPNVFVSGALFFAGGTLSRNIMYVYVQGIAFLVLWLLATGIVSDMDNRTFAALIEPSGFQAISELNRYWTATQKNESFIYWEGIVLMNRLLWLGIAFAALAFTYFRFKFEVGEGDGFFSKLFRRNKKKAETQEKTVFNLPIPSVHPYFGLMTQIRQILALTRVYYLELIKAVPFLAIAGMGLIMFFVNAQNANKMYDTSVFPTTYIMLELISGFSLFFMIILVFYSGQLIWREREIKMNQIYDALPMPNYVGLVSKFLAFSAVNATLILVLIVSAVFNQAIRGYYEFELGLYFSYLFAETFSGLLLYTLLAFFIQIVSNNKFLGFVLLISFFLIMGIAGQLGVEHKMLIFNSANLGAYSAMNSFGHYVAPFSWFSVYWTMFAMVLFGFSVLLAVRGTDTLAKIRLQLMKQRFARPIATFLIASLLFFCFSGAYIFYNTNVLNKYQNSKQEEKDQAEYEKTLKKYEKIAQPKIVEQDIAVDIFPDTRDFHAKGFYWLKNKTNEVIPAVHIQLNPDENISVEKLEFEGGATVQQKWDKFKYSIYQLAKPLQPNDSVKLSFSLKFETKGFVNRGSNTEVVENGTFINNTYFPLLGYSTGAELFDNEKRKKNGLADKNQNSPDPTDEAALHHNLFGDDADNIRFQIQISTTEDQIALAPGYLQKKWVEKGRSYYHYKMDVPMCNFYNISSARYVVKKDKYKDIDLEIYYDKAHTFNIDRMLDAMKKSLKAFEEMYGPYQYRQLRILEFPRYRSFAQSFANTVPYSEGIGFIMDAKEADVDMCFYVTAHEIGHQWWGHQVTEAGVKGSAMLSETMAQYSALMVMKHHFSPEIMQKFLREELDRYLRGRAGEFKRENPMVLTDGQSYIHYNKGSVVMYALQDYIGEDSVNAALRKFIRDWKWRDDKYPTAQQLVSYFRQVAPDSMQNTITDLFEKITLYSLRANKPTYKKVGNEYEVTIPVHAEKKYFAYEKDVKGKEVGREKAATINDYIDIGVMGADEKGKDKLLYLKREKINKADMTFTVKVKEKPLKAGIDPIHKLVDLDTKDNLETVKE
ncbi:MAG: M1 family aminopeptidase [Bacteroidia bacterium]